MRKTKRNIFQLKYMNQILKLSFILIALGLTLFVIGCSKPHYGCSKREVKQSARYFVRSVNKCQTEAMRQSLIYFPFISTDTNWTEYTKGTDTIWMPSEVVEFDCDSFIKWRNSQEKPAISIKASVNCPPCFYTIDTIKKYQKTVKEDQRRIGILNAEISEGKEREASMAVEISEKNAKIAAVKSSRNIWRNLFIGLATLIALAIGVKFYIPKVLSKA